MRAFAGDRALALRKMVAFVRLDPPIIPWWDVAARHISAANLYFLSVGLNETSGNDDMRPVDAAHGDPFPVLADASDDVVKARMNAPVYWKQYGNVFVEKHW